VRTGEFTKEVGGRVRRLTGEGQLANGKRLSPNRNGRLTDGKRLFPNEAKPVLRAPVRRGQANPEAVFGVEPVLQELDTLVAEFRSLFVRQDAQTAAVQQIAKDIGMRPFRKSVRPRRSSSSTGIRRRASRYTHRSTTP